MRRAWWLSFTLLVALAAGAWLTLKPAHPKAPGQPLTLLLTCDVDGRLVPCGCFSGQLGGVTRIATLFGPASPDQIRVDAGNALSGTADYERILYSYIQQAFGKLGYDALNVGEREARLSATQLRELKAHSPVPMLSANLIDRSTGAPLFDTHRIIERNGWRVALVGVLDGRGLGDTLGEGLAIEDMDVALGRLLPQLKGRADFIILLAFADEAALTNLARQFYELDVILGGKVRQPSQELLKENRSLILATTNEARAVGMLQVAWRAPHLLGPLKGEVQLVSDQVAQDPNIAALATAYREEIRRTKLAIDDPATLREDMVPGVQPHNSYAGTQSCTQCHPNAAKIWLKSGHAQAFASLVNRQADADPNCISCHTVGFGTATGYRREAGAKSPFIDVGCESCHGPGGEHVKLRSAGGAVDVHFRPVGAGDCQKCHHGEFSRPFDYASFWPEIAHGKEPAAVKSAKPPSPE
ncbi:5'-nucleotidase/2' 3'-cyclic phosphodiesterase and related esterase-like protein [Chthoniobacter flavus Ellin428]|uniref:5'-nucleotidase/2' 3'-cyclic phosphodiesterase and related esterase-like protein n=1 Tax=Chthoniobacter flavus Ellin428 TaxID=497964 RepID=B4D6J2_9BACT|nr:multiheme c-type cytochrome [Chthoniobacter flavus]EDY17793.1 5'-nucleotidase/2' 3'-cyclic phosphodiesterase and related esterase-like protein [Chthoniobacter flavus Ellin428]TCO88406.1 cytochrome c554/c'-like protein [Chthoniobacter flavus]